MKVVVVKPYYDWDARKYIELLLEDQRVLRVKVPFRYGRVSCRYGGLKTVQEFQAGDVIECELDKKTWNGASFWVLNYIKEIE